MRATSARSRSRSRSPTDEAAGWLSSPAAAHEARAVLPHSPAPDRDCLPELSLQGVQPEKVV